MVLVGGGTGGHVTPLVALASEITTKYPSWEIHYLGAVKDKIGQRLTGTGLFTSRHFMCAGKWRRFGKVKKRELFYFWHSDFWLNLGNFFLLNIGFWQSLFYLRRQRPHLLFSKGGYVAVGPCLAALILKIPLVLHDSDAVSGVAHSVFKRYAKMQLSGFKTDFTDEKRQRHVGVPVNPILGEELTDQQRVDILSKYNLPAEAEFILVTGGSGGARNLNRAVLEVADYLKFKPNVYLVIIAGRLNYEETKEKVTQLKSASKIRVLDFADELPDLMRASLGVVTRAGATILTEISLAKKAAIIIPNPLLPRGHQLHNARIYQKADAAWLVSDSGQKVNQRALKQALSELVNDTAKRLKYERNAAGVAVVDATEKTLLAIEEVLANLKVGKHKSLEQIVKFRHDSSGRTIGRGFGRFLKFLILVLLITGFLFKVFYVGSIEFQLIEESPLLGEAELTDLRNEVNSLLDDRSFFQRHFFLDLTELNDRLIGKSHIEDISFRRDLVSSKVIVNIQPKHILGAFITPHLKTVVTTDGYAIKGYEHLLSQEKLSLEIKSSQDIVDDQELVLTPLDISFLNQIQTYLASRGYKLNEARISSQPREIVFRLKDMDLDIIALTTVDPIEQGIALAVALEFFAEPEKSEGIEELLEPAVAVDGSSNKLVKPTEYIDIRLIDRVIYK